MVISDGDDEDNPWRKRKKWVQVEDVLDTDSDKQPK
jgi:hypothetical protein